MMVMEQVIKVRCLVISSFTGFEVPNFDFCSFLLFFKTATHWSIILARAYQGQIALDNIAPGMQEPLHCDNAGIHRGVKKPKCSFSQKTGGFMLCYFYLTFVHLCVYWACACLIMNV